jgi:hypothetical protein
MSKEHEIAESLCQIHGKSIEGAFFRAVKHFYELHKDELFTIRAATKAALINDYIYQYLQDALENTSPFQFIMKPRGRFIGYDSKILIRIKKLSKSRKPTINSTISAGRFNTQGDMELIEDTKASNIYLGYVLNRDSGDIDQVAFAYPNETGVIAWTINIDEQLIQKTLDLNIVPFTSGGEGSARGKPSHFSPKYKSKRKNKS